MTRWAVDSSLGRGKLREPRARQHCSQVRLEISTHNRNRIKTTWWWIRRSETKEITNRKQERLWVCAHQEIWINPTKSSSQVEQLVLQPILDRLVDYYRILTCTLSNNSSRTSKIRTVHTNKLWIRTKQPLDLAIDSLSSSSSQVPVSAWPKAPITCRVAQLVKQAQVCLCDRELQVQQAFSRTGEAVQSARARVSRIVLEEPVAELVPTTKALLNRSPVKVSSSNIYPKLPTQATFETTWAEACRPQGFRARLQFRSRKGWMRGSAISERGCSSASASASAREVIHN